MSQIPQIVFIVPYRNRPQQKYFFSNYLTTIMRDRTDYEIYFSHQCDDRTFNRGAAKNIGFLAIKKKYPNDYHNITFVFNDIDTVPFSNIFDFNTDPGIIKHFYGFEYALGGILAINGGDFEATNGYPNFWGWGMEDRVLQTRCEKVGLQVDRSQFFSIGDPNIIHLFDGVARIINSNDPIRATNDNGIDGIKTVHKLEYSVDTQSQNELDNIHIVDSSRIFIINIKTFMTGIRFENERYHQYDLREPPQNIMYPNNNKMKTNYSTDDWSNIPFYPTAQKKQELVHQYGHQQAAEIIQYSYNNSSTPTREVIPPNMLNQQNQIQQIQQYNQAMRQMNSNQRVIPPNINKFSPAYARIIAAKPKAASSVRIGLGGVY
jgi:hypothetical protein